MTTLGFRILPAPAPPDATVVAQLGAFGSANVADAMGRFNFMDPGIRARTPRRVCGVAVTVNARPADNLMVHKALEVARPGDVVVVSTGGNTTNAVFGDLMCRSAVAARLGGIVVDGAIRDVAGIEALGFAAFSRSVSPGACDKDGPGEVNVPIACGGAVVMAGDVIVGDEDGVVVVPREHVAAVLAEVVAIAAREAKRIAEIAAGGVFKPDIDETLRRKGVIA